MGKAAPSNYWLIKAEPESRMEKGVDVKVLSSNQFSIDDLEKCNVSSWEGVRNYEARNTLRDKMKIGDIVWFINECLFYHSNCKLPGIAGLARVVKEGYVDHTAFDPKHPYYDPKSDESNPKWYMVDVAFERKLARFISLKELQKYKSTDLKEMPLLQRGRLSVQPVDKNSFEFILSLEKQESE
jgi:predicted RNA-binding protein with PUA-like domain